MQAIRKTTTPAADRQHVVAELMGLGLSSGTANWLATNLQRMDDGFVWRFNLEAISELMLDYFRMDLWAVLEHPTSDSDLRVVVAERSDRWAPENRARIQRMADETAISLHVVPNAGHWLHVDNPGFLLELMGRDLY
jgi:pimeloyl-ACP methyl ester carboxylesterase